MKSIRKVLKEESGTRVVENGVVSALIAVAAITVMPAIGAIVADLDAILKW
jgi:Flp pilus assembly pilin Flp